MKIREILVVHLGRPVFLAVLGEEECSFLLDIEMDGRLSLINSIWHGVGVYTSACEQGVNRFNSHIAGINSSFFKIKHSRDNHMGYRVL